MSILSFEGLKVSITSDPLSSAFNLYIYYSDGSDVRVLNKDGKMVTRKEGEVLPEPTMLLPVKSLQSLADELANLGVYQSKAKPLENELSATKYHLEDMRELVFKKKQTD